MYNAINAISFIVSISWLYNSPGYEPILAVIANVLFHLKSELFGVIGKNLISLTPKSSLIYNLGREKYSFVEDTFINPKIIDDLVGWLSDTGDQIVSINIHGSNDSNRYFGDLETTYNNKKSPIVTLRDDNESYSYQYIGRSISGIHILQTWCSGGGSGVFGGVIFITINREYSITDSDIGLRKTDRLVMKKLGYLGLCDRYCADITYKCSFLRVPAYKDYESKWLIVLLSCVQNQRDTTPISSPSYPVLVKSI